MESMDYLLDMLEKQNEDFKKLFSSFQNGIQFDIKADFKAITTDIHELDKKVQQNTIETASKLSSIETKVESLMKGQDQQDELIDEIRTKQLQCPAANNWDSMVKVVDSIHSEMKRQNDDITGIQAIERLKRSSHNPNKRFDLPKWLPLLLAIITAAGIIGGAAAIQWARSDEVKVSIDKTKSALLQGEEKYKDSGVDNFEIYYLEEYE